MVVVRWAALAFLSVAFFSCGHPGHDANSGDTNRALNQSSDSHTKVSFNTNGLFAERGFQTSSTLDQLLIYAVDSSDSDFSGSFIVNSESPTSSWLLPNGTYTFVALGYPSGSTVNTYCGTQSGVVLAGTDTTVSLTLTRAGCNNTQLIADSSYQHPSTASAQPQAIPPLHFISCSSSGFSNASVAGYCTSTGNSGQSRSLTIEAIDYNAFDGTLEERSSNGVTPHSSSCLSGGSTFGYDIPQSGTAPVFPVGVGNASPIALLITAYTDTSCTTGAHYFFFKHGLTGDVTTSAPIELTDFWKLTKVRWATLLSSYVKIFYYAGTSANKVFLLDP